MTDTATSKLESIRQALPDAAKDLKLNLQSVLKSEALSPTQSYGAALASAYYIGDERLIEAVLEEGQANGLDEKAIDDAKAAAAIMGMNTVYYRFRHMIGKQSYQQMPARLRMNRMMQPATDKATFEVYSMAVAALAGCEMCIKSHEQSITKHGLSEDAVHDAVRIAAAVNGAAVGMRL